MLLDSILAIARVWAGEDIASDVAESTAVQQRRDLSELSSRFSALRQLNRTSYESFLSARQSVLEARTTVEQAQLAMQNSKYEKDHLEGEIARCRGYRSRYQDVEMHSVEEFLQLADEEDLAGVQTQEGEDSTMDPHQLMLARLRFELKERKRLEQERKALIQQRNEASKVAKQKKAELIRVEQDIQSVIAAARPIGTSLDKFLA